MKYLNKQAINLIDSDEAQRALKSGIPLGELLITGLGAGAGGTLGYALSKLLHKDPSFKTKLLYILSGGGLGGLAGSIYVNKAAPSGRFKGSKSLKEDMVLASVYSDMPIQERLKYRDAAKLIDKNKPSILQKYLGVSVPLAFGLGNAGYRSYKYNKSYKDAVDSYNTNIVAPFKDSSNIKVNSKSNKVTVSPILRHLEKNIDPNVGYTTEILSDGSSINIPKEKTTNVNDLIDPSIEKRVRLNNVIGGFSDAASASVLTSNIINKMSDTPVDTHHTGAIAGGLLGIRHNPVNLLPVKKSAPVKLLGILGSIVAGHFTDSTGYEKK